MQGFINQVTMIILGFDPGRDKCGLAIADSEEGIKLHEVITGDQLLLKLNQYVERYGPTHIVMGNQTTSKEWRSRLEQELPSALPITMVDERHTTLLARDRYWEMYPPRGLTKLIPPGMRLPPRPIDDIVAILLIEKFLGKPLPG